MVEFLVPLTRDEHRAADNRSGGQNRRLVLEKRVHWNSHQTKQIGNESKTVLNIGTAAGKQACPRLTESLRQGDTFDVLYKLLAVFALAE